MDSTAMDIANGYVQDTDKIFPGNVNSFIHINHSLEHCRYYLIQPLHHQKKKKKGKQLKNTVALVTFSLPARINSKKKRTHTVHVVPYELHHQAFNG